jgi:hypothetical protein
MVSFSEGNVKILQYLLRLVYKTIQANRLVRTLPNVRGATSHEWRATGHSGRSKMHDDAKVARYGSVAYGPGDGRGVPNMETGRTGKSKPGQKTSCAAARSREGGLFLAGDETTGSKPKIASAKILRESISYVEHFPSGEKYGHRADEQQMSADRAEFKRGGGGPGSKARGHIHVSDEQCVNGDESAGEAEYACGQRNGEVRSHSNGGRYTER